jgi:transcriptional regulator with XRE-family HTH domain
MKRKPRIKTIPEKAHPVVQAIFREMNSQNMTYNDLADRSGVSKKLLERWRLSTEPQLSTLWPVLNVLNLKYGCRHKRQ